MLLRAQASRTAWHCQRSRCYGLGSLRFSASQRARTRLSRYSAHLVWMEVKGVDVLFLARFVLVIAVCAIVRLAVVLHGQPGGVRADMYTAAQDQSSALLVAVRASRLRS